MSDSTVHKLLNIDCTEKDFFDAYIEWLEPTHKLTKSEQKYLAACLRNRYKLSKGITDENLLDETCMNDVYRTKIREEIGFSSQQSQNVISKLKKLKMLVARKYPFTDKVQYYKIAPKLIPNYNEDKDFILVLSFNGKNHSKTSSEGVQPADTDN
jgi:hypothetical protein